MLMSMSAIITIHCCRCCSRRSIAALTSPKVAISAVNIKHSYISQYIFQLSFTKEKAMATIPWTSTVGQDTINAANEWNENWRSASMVNRTLASDPTIQGYVAKTCSNESPHEITPDTHQAWFLPARPTKHWWCQKNTSCQYCSDGP